MYIENDVILLQRQGVTRLVIPSILRKDILHLLHEAHWGVTRTKQMARRYVWWPNINGDVKNLVQSCLICPQTAKAPVVEFKSWPKTRKPWERIRLDYAGPFYDKMWLICVDAFSKYPYVTMLNVGQTTSKHTIDVLERIFVIEGLPDTIVANNGPQFVSSEFDDFCVHFNIKHLTSLVFQPASIGEAERFVQTFKYGLEKNIKGKSPS